MKFGLIQLKRMTRNKDTDWYWDYQEPDDIDREYSGEEDYPWSSIFWYFPEHLSREEVFNRMLAKQLQEMKKEHTKLRKIYKALSKEKERK